MVSFLSIVREVNVTWAIYKIPQAGLGDLEEHIARQRFAQNCTAYHTKASISGHSQLGP